MRDNPCDISLEELFNSSCVGFFLICNYSKHAVTSRYYRSHVFSFPRNQNVKQVVEKYCDIKYFVCTEYTAVLVI